MQQRSELEANYQDIKEKDSALRQESNKRLQEKVIQFTRCRSRFTAFECCVLIILEPKEVREAYYYNFASYVYTYIV